MVHVHVTCGMRRSRAHARAGAPTVPLVVMKSCACTRACAALALARRGRVRRAPCAHAEPQRGRRVITEPQWKHAGRPAPALAQRLRGVVRYEVELKHHAPGDHVGLRELNERTEYVQKNT